MSDVEFGFPSILLKVGLLDVLKELSEENQSKVELSFSLPSHKPISLSGCLNKAMQKGLVKQSSVGKYMLTEIGEVVYDFLASKENYQSMVEKYRMLKAEAELREGEIISTWFELAPELGLEVRDDFRDDFSRHLINESIESQEVASVEELVENTSLTASLAKIWDMSEDEMKSCIKGGFERYGMEQVAESFDSGGGVDKESASMEIWENMSGRRRFIDNVVDSIKSVQEDYQPEVKKKEQDVMDLIERGEGQKTEFKETFLYDVHQNQANKELKEEVVKEICAFGNTKGGKLIIGVEDENKTVKGLERDFKLMKKKQDSFELQLNQEIADHLGKVFASQLVEINFEEVNDKTVCVVSVHQSRDPVFFDEDEFYIRRGSSSDPLNGKETQNYIDKHFR